MNTSIIFRFRNILKYEDIPLDDRYYFYDMPERLWLRKQEGLYKHKKKYANKKTYIGFENDPS